jgi:hypothetical protein
MNRRIVCGLSFLIVGMASGCTEKELTVEPVPFRPRALITPPSASGDLPVGSSTNPANSLPLPSYDYEVIVQLQIGGMISTAARSDTYLQAYSGNLDGSGIYVESAFSACYANITFRFSVTGNRGPGPCLYYPAPVSSWADTTLVQGTASVTRGPGIPQFTSDCNYSPCHSYSGSQTVSVTPLSATLQLAGSATQVDSGQTVVFTATVTPSSIKGIQVPLKILTWRWLPSGGGTGLTGACSNPVNPCSAVIREAGAMELTALANGAEQVGTATVAVNGAQVVLSPQQARIKFSIHCCNPLRDEPSFDTVSVSVVGTNGSRLQFKTVTLSLAATEGTAGHIHIGGKPTGTIATSVNTGESGVIKTPYTASLVSGPVTLTGSSPGATSGTASIDIGQWNLQQLTAGAHYSLTGDIAGQHTQNHWAKAFHIQKIQELADLFFAQFGEGPTFNDTSLPVGGLYDVASTAPWNPPHQSHAEGRSTDIKTIGLDSDQLAFVKATWKKWQKLGAYLGDETVIRVKGQPDRPNTVNPHYHLTIGPIN